MPLVERVPSNNGTIYRLYRCTKLRGRQVRFAFFGPGVARTITSATTAEAARAFLVDWANERERERRY